MQIRKWFLEGLHGPEHSLDWTVTKLAEEAGMTVSYIRRLLRNEVIKGEKFAHVWRIPEEEALKFLDGLEKPEEEPADS